MDADARLEALERENERLREQITMLEAALGLAWLPPVEFRLTGKEARILGCLLQRESASKETLMAALYDANADEEPQIKIIDVFVCKMRGKLRLYGISIRTLWGFGYAMEAEDKARVRAFSSAQAA